MEGREGGIKLISARNGMYYFRISLKRGANT